jgi:chromosome segregation protein
MLKALELVGFKSFADKTRFEFPSGVTVVVGPNGSGKSNVVDAVKWVLGEQSVKSLRGREMADVIFNGSGSRRPMNSAEITITLDNSSGRLAIDSAEVHITRRVYRSGEGEYLINRQPSRLRDIRDLLAGTGLGADAYCVIEQGKVDGLLQASARDRRLIFEEAAGISRFRAKKVETQRRLERVEQNLLRLSDIVEEVDARLRTVRTQAGKARRYKEHTERLQELRTQVGLVDWRRFSERLAALETECRAIADERDAALAEVEILETQTVEADAHAAEISEAIRAAEAQIAATRERIAAAESTVDHQRTLSADLEQEIARYRRAWVAMNARAGDLQQQMADTGVALESAETEHRQIAGRLSEGQRAVAELSVRLDQLRAESQQRRQSILDTMRRGAALASQASACESRAAAAQAAHDRAAQRIGELDVERQTQQAHFARLRAEVEELERSAERCEADVVQAQQRRDEHRQELAGLRLERGTLRDRQTALAERTAVLDELDQRQEGVSAGVKEVLALAHGAAETPLRSVCGLVADLVQVSVETAPLIEVILGAAAQYVVAPKSRALVEWIQSRAGRLSGRVGFLWIDEEPASTAPAFDPTGRPGVIGRADEFVEADPRFAWLVRRLLGRTWIVEKLAHALALAETAGPGWSFVTLAGERLDGDGTLVVGPRQAGAGLISRRSELRALRGQMAELDARLTQIQSRLRHMEQVVAADEQRLANLNAEHQTTREALRQQQFALATVEQDGARLDQQRAELSQELETAATDAEQAAATLTELAQERRLVDQTLAEQERTLAEVAARIGVLETEQQARARETTEIKVDLAKSEERLENLHARLRQFQETQQERERAIAESRAELFRAVERQRETQRTILRAEAEIAERYLEKEAVALQTARHMRRRAEIQEQRTALQADAQRVRTRIRKVEERLHAKQLEASEVRHERSTLVARLREDYGIELAQLENEPTPEEQRQRAEVQQEIDELRRKINNLGNVNLEALEELEELETRYQGLSGQYQDLASAKGSLEKIIDKINADSRRLFIDTFQTVKGHFQQLFRDLFGGGRADLALEEGVDVLDSGIEIVARPPGKEPRNISLLSGGEKTLTCVALLLAIFRSRPSPFCILDEVDAALDEANIDRFTKVLQDFLSWTQFILVTHSKKTMTCASTIYGVTMQESGVSKQVSVRFEDVRENGEIRPADEQAA